MISNNIIELRKYGAKIGENVYIGEDVYFEVENLGFLEISDGAVISAHCKFVFHDSSLNNVTGDPIRYGKIRIGKNSYIGFDTLLLPGTLIADNVIIGAGSLVSGNYPSENVYIGRPAKQYCTIKELQEKWQNTGDRFHKIKTEKWFKRSIEQSLDLEQQKKKILNT